MWTRQCPDPQHRGPRFLATLRVQQIPKHDAVERALCDAVAARVAKVERMFWPFLVPRAAFNRRDAHRVKSARVALGDLVPALWLSASVSCQLGFTRRACMSRPGPTRSQGYAVLLTHSIGGPARSARIGC